MRHRVQFPAPRPTFNVVLKNLTKDTILATDLKECVSFKDRNLGLMDPENPRSLLFKTRFGIHTFGLRESIDVIVLNNKQKIVKLKSGLKPGQIFLWNPLFNIVVELPKETINKSDTKVDDLLEITW